MSKWSRRQLLSSMPAWPLVASSLAAAPRDSVLRAGAATADITLPVGANNGGVILRGEPVRSIHDDLNARCLVLDDGKTALAIVVCDLRMIRREAVDRAKQLAATALGWPTQNMLVAAPHTHAAPGLVGIADADVDRWYEEFVVLRIADAIRRAAAQRSPARIGWGSAMKPEHVFNRRWKVEPGTAPANPFGTSDDIVLTNPGKTAKLLEPAGPVDPELSILSVQHADGRPLAVLANYGLHYVGGYTSHSVSADYFAVFADRLGQLLDTGESGAMDNRPPFVGIMSNGTSGDVNNHNVAGPKESHAAWEKMRVVAEYLAQTAASICRSLEYRDSISLAVATENIDLAVRRPDQERLQWARDVVDRIRDRKKLSRPEVYAEEAIALSEGLERVSVPVQAMRLGELGIAASSCEVFASTGLEIKKQSPLRPTFVIELANGYDGYLPTPEQHALGGYETWPARSSYLEVEASEKIRVAALRLLERVSGG